MHPEQAVQTVQQVERLRRETHSTVHDLWFPCALFGSLMLLSAGILATAGGPAVGLYWAVAGPLGGIATGEYYRRRERRLGVEGPALAYILTGVAIMVGCFLTGGIGGATDRDMLAGAGTLLVISAGALVLGLLARTASMAVGAVVLAALVVAMWAAGVEPRVIGPLGTAVYGGAALAAGLAYRSSHRRRS
jgi:hypothetical protein